MNKIAKIENLNTFWDIIKHWFLFVIVWILSYLELNIVFDLLEKWSNHYYISSYPLRFGRLGEIIIFALAVVISIYAVGITLFEIGYFFYKKFHGIRYYALYKLHLLVVSAFLVHLVIFLLIFYHKT